MGALLRFPFNMFKLKSLQVTDQGAEAGLGCGVFF